MSPPARPSEESASAGDDRPLEELLRAAVPAYLDDAGFSARILRALPPDRRRAERRRLALLCAGLAAGLGAAALLGGEPLRQGLARSLGAFLGWLAMPVPGAGSDFTMARSWPWCSC